MSNWFFEDDEGEALDPDDEVAFIGWFECQSCGKVSGRADYDRDNGTLEWTCPCGNRSKVEMEL